MNKITQPTMLEKTIEQKIVDYCTENNIFQQKLLGKKGMPDRIFYLWTGRVVFIEFKQPGESLQRLQKVCHETLKCLKFSVYVCNNYEAGIKFLHEELKRL